MSTETTATDLVMDARRAGGDVRKVLSEVQASR